MTFIFFSKILLLSPVKLIISVSFGIFLVTAVVGAAADWSPPMRWRDPERDLENIMPFALATAVAALFVLRRGAQVTIALMRKIEEFMQELRQRSAKSASKVSGQDNRPPILFLRSFADDEVSVADLPPIPRFLWRTEYSRRLEEVVADIAWLRGPLIATL